MYIEYISDNNSFMPTEQQQQQQIAIKLSSPDTPGHILQFD